MKSNTLINCLVLFYNVGIFPSDILIFIPLFIDLYVFLNFLQQIPKNNSAQNLLQPQKAKMLWKKDIKK